MDHKFEMLSVTEEHKRCRNTIQNSMPAMID
jgi:hypothetical protein